MCAVCIAVYISEFRVRIWRLRVYCGFWRNRCQNTTHIPREKMWWCLEVAHRVAYGGGAAVIVGKGA